MKLKPVYTWNAIHLIWDFGCVFEVGTGIVLICVYLILKMAFLVPEMRSSSVKRSQAISVAMVEDSLNLYCPIQQLPAI